MSRNESLADTVYAILDGYVETFAPGGVAEDTEAMHLTTEAYTHYVATYGVPTTANAARHMFEWAAALDLTFTTLRQMRND